MTLKPFPSLLGALLLLTSCGSRTPLRQTECYGPLETSSSASTVQTKSGPVAGYVDDGVFIYKGILRFPNSR